MTGNCSEWRVSNNPSMGDKPYIVYRLRDVHAVDHSGNREYCGEYTSNKGSAQRVADKLNSNMEVI